MDFEQAAKIFNEFISCVAYKNLRNFVTSEEYRRNGGNLYDGVYLSDYHVTISGEIETSVMTKQLATLGGKDKVAAAFQTIMLAQPVEQTSRQSAAHALGMLYQFYLRDTVQATSCYRYGALLNGEVAKKLFDNITRTTRDVPTIVFNRALLQSQTRGTIDAFSIAELSKRHGVSIIGLLLDDPFLSDKQKKKILFNTLEQIENLRATASRFRMRFYIAPPATQNLDDVVAKASNYLAGEVNAPEQSNSIRATN